MSAEEVTKVCETAKKGKCLFALQHYEPGDVIYVEKALIVCQPSSEIYKAVAKALAGQRLDYGVGIYASAVMSVLSGEVEVQDKIETMFISSGLEPKFCEFLVNSLRNTELTRTRADVWNSDTLMKHLRVWMTNSFSRGDGSAIYERASYMAHSCTPSARWSSVGVDEFELRALLTLEPGDELTISYLSTDEVIRPTFMRRDILQTLWRFRCECERCSEVNDPFRAMNRPQCVGGALLFPAEVRREPRV